MSEKNPRKGKGQFKIKSSITNPFQNNEDKIRQLMAEVNRYLKEQNYKELIKSCDEMKKLDPNVKEVYNNRGISYKNLGEYNRAIIDYTKAIEIDNKYTEAYNNRGISYRNLGKYKKSIVDYNKAIELNSNMPDIYSNRGLAYNDLGEYSKAIDDYNKAIDLDAMYTIAYLNRGVTYSNLKDCDKAIIDYNKAIEIDPDFKEVYRNRGNLYRNLKDFDKAINDLDKAIEIDPNFRDAYFNRALVCQDLREYKKAINYYTKVIEIDPDFKDAYLNRGVSYKNLGKNKEAISDYTIAIKLDPTDHKAYFNRGVSYANLEKYNEALKNLTVGAVYQVYFLLIHLYKTKKIDKEQVIDTIKAIINKQKNDIFESKKTNRDKTTNEIIDIIKNKNGDQIDIDPHTLYSYVPFDKNTIDAIVQGYKYANEIFDFNDPTDPTIKLIPETKEIIEILKNIRIACFSTSPLSTLMYSHYTDKHKGICIEYDFSDFDTENTSLLEVKYKEELKIDSKIVQIMMKSDNDINEEISFLDLFRTKHLNWEYEKEYRVMTYDVDKIYRPIKAIYLGKDFPKDNIELIKKLIEDKDITLYQVALHEHNVFRLEAKEI